MPIPLKRQKGTYGQQTVGYRHIDGQIYDARIVGSQAMGVPTGLAVVTVGTAGAATYGYRVSALGGGVSGGETTAATEVTIATGNATLDGTNFNRVSWNEVAGAASYAIYRTTGGGTQGKIGVVASGTTPLRLDDTGLAASGAVPGSNTAVTYNIHVPSLKPAGASAMVKTVVGVIRSRADISRLVAGR